MLKLQELLYTKSSYTPAMASKKPLVNLVGNKTTEHQCKTNPYDILKDAALYDSVRPGYKEVIYRFLSTLTNKIDKKPNDKGKEPNDIYSSAIILADVVKSYWKNLASLKSISDRDFHSPFFYLNLNILFLGCGEGENDLKPFVKIILSSDLIKNIRVSGSDYEGIKRKLHNRIVQLENSKRRFNKSSDSYEQYKLIRHLKTSLNYFSKNNSYFDCLKINIVGVDSSKLLIDKLCENIKKSEINIPYIGSNASLENKHEIKHFFEKSWLSINLYSSNLEKFSSYFYEDYDSLGYRNKVVKFDFIFSFFTLHHITNIPRFMIKLTDTLLRRQGFSDKKVLLNDPDNFKFVPNGRFYLLKSEKDNPITVYENGFHSYAAEDFKFIGDYFLMNQKLGRSYDKIIKASKTDILGKFDFLGQKASLKESLHGLTIPANYLKILPSNPYDFQMPSLFWGREIVPDNLNHETITSHLPDDLIHLPTVSYSLDIYYKYDLTFDDLSREFRDSKQDPVLNEKEELFKAKLQKNYTSYFDAAFSQFLNLPLPSISKHNKIDYFKILQTTFLQRILGYGGLRYNTRFVGIVDKGIPFREKPFELISSLVQNSHDKLPPKAFSKLARHYKYVLSNPKESFSDIIYKPYFDKYDAWIFTLSTDNKTKCKIYPSEVDNFNVVFVELPKLDKFYGTQEVDYQLSEYLCNFKNRNYQKFDNYYTGQFENFSEHIEASKQDDISKVILVDLENKLKLQFSKNSIKPDLDDSIWQSLAIAISKYYYILKNNNTNKNTYLVHIKKSLEYLEGYDRSSVGGIFIGEAELEFENGKLNTFDMARYAFLRRCVGNYLTSVKLPDALQEIKKLKERLDDISILHAISRIISRDSAHHIGSHVSFNSTNKAFKDRLREVMQEKVSLDSYSLQTSINSQVKELFNSDKKIVLKKDIEKIIKINQDQTRLTHQLFDYLIDKQKKFEIIRSEYCAQPFMTPKNCWIYKDVVYPFIENMILMDNIGKGEGVCFLDPDENQIQVNLGKINRENLYSQCTVVYPDIEYKNCQLSYPRNLPFHFGLLENYDIENFLDCVENKNYCNDFEICIRHEHSLYLIMEGVLRNAIKHHQHQFNSELGKLHLNITFSDGLFNDERKEEDFFEAYIYPTILNADSHQNLLKASLKTINGIKDRINDKIIEGAALQTQGYNGDLGIASLKTNAFILGKNEQASEEGLMNALEVVIFLEDNFNPNEPTNYINNENIIETEKYNGKNYLPKNLEKEIIPEILEKDAKLASPTNIIDKNTAFGFGYRILIPKPKKVVILQDIKKKQLNSDVINGGNRIVSIEQVEYVSSKAVSSYEFAIVPDDIIEDTEVFISFLKSALLKFPNRCLLNTQKSKEEIKTDFPKFYACFIDNYRIIPTAEKITYSWKSMNSDKLIEKCWKNWLNKWDVNGSGRTSLSFVPGNDDSKITTPKKEKAYSYIQLKHNQDLTFVNGKNLVYDHHGKKCKTFNGKFQIMDDYYSILSKEGGDLSLIKHLNLSKEKNLINKMIEAALLKILIVDERLFIGNNTYHPDLEYLKNCDLVNSNIDKYLKLKEGIMSKTILATHFMDNPIRKETWTKWTNHDSQPPYKINLNYNVKTERWVLENGLCVEGNDYKFDVIIIHRTLLKENMLLNENSYYKDKDQKSEEMKNRINKLYDLFPLVIVDSGGGSPYTVPGDYKFIPYHKIHEAWAGLISKMYLTQTVLTANKNENYFLNRKER